MPCKYLNAGIVKIVTPKTIKRAHKKGLAVHPWTINDYNEMKKLLEWGVDGMFTDDPDLLLKVLQEFTQEQNIQQQE